MIPTQWTIRFDNYLPVDERLSERLRRVVAEFDRLPDAAIRLDEAARVIVIDCARIPGWEDAARGLVRTLQVGKRLVVKPLWEPYTAAPEEVVLEIDAQGVFGSGLHETTGLCLQLLERYVTPGCACVDFGTGSGILAIAAAKLGADRVLALDALAGAVARARENARWNGVDERVRVEVADRPPGDGTGTDLLIANITGTMVRAHAAALFGTLRSEGVLIVSGIGTREAADVADCLSAVGFRIDQQVANGQWVALVAAAAGPGAPPPEGDRRKGRAA